MTEIDYANARPLDVHRWSEYPEVNDFVGHVSPIYWWQFSDQQEAGESDPAWSLCGLVCLSKINADVQPRQQRL